LALYAPSVKYNDQAQLDPSQMGGGGGRSHTGKIALGGGGGLLVLVLALLFGLNPGDLLGSGQDPTQPGGSSTQFAQCRNGSDVRKNRDCRFVAYTNSIQDYWSSAVDNYQKIQVDTFTGSISTACGQATSAVGPFYCSGDTTVYLDLGFFDQLTGDLGAKGGDAAEAYVLAHEFGHHIQDLTGTMRSVQSQGQQTGAKSGSVRLELQADCYAGVWFKHATSDPDGPIAEVSSDDLDRAVDAAAAVGDDRIQKKMRGQVSPETFTHGTAAQRQKWLGQGFNTGDPERCNTFAKDALD
jgi:predicted metalloprotease